MKMDLRAEKIVTREGDSYYWVSWSVYRAGRYVRTELSRKSALELLIGILSFRDGDIAPTTVDIEKMANFMLDEADEENEYLIDETSPEYEAHVKVPYYEEGLFSVSYAT